MLDRAAEVEVKQLVELLEYAIAQRFPELTEEEVSSMLQLTPPDQTTAGKQIYGRGYNQGLDKGEILGRIRLAQQLLKQPISPKEALAEKNEAELLLILKHLETSLQIQ